MTKMIGIVKYYHIENRGISRGIIVTAPMDGVGTKSEIKIGKANLKQGEDIFEGDVVSFELERNDNERLVRNVLKAVNDEEFLAILQNGNFQNNYSYLKNFIFNYDSYAYQNFKIVISSLIPDEVAEKEVVVWPELNPKKVEAFISKRYKDSDDSLDTYNCDKNLFKNVNAEKWFRLRYVPCIPKDILLDNRKMWEDVDEKTVKSLLMQSLQTADKLDSTDIEWIEKYPTLWDSLSSERIIETITGNDTSTPNRHMVNYLLGRLPIYVIENEKSLWKFLPEKKLEAIVKKHINDQRILWDLDRLYLINHRELFYKIPIRDIKKTPQMWDYLDERLARLLVKCHLNKNLTEHWEWDKGWILKHPDLLELKREYLTLIDEELLNGINREDLTNRYWQLCYENEINKEKANKEIIKQEIKKRGIRHLYHFTRASNLESILNYGILPRTTLDNYSLQYEYNDAERFDRCTNAVCTSIEFPNYKMFWSLRKNTSADWVVLELDAKILYELDCAFCWENASKSDISRIRIEERKSCAAFKGLFDNRVGRPQRDPRLNDSDPTNPQAEVLVFSSIPVDYITNIYFNDENTKNNYINHVNILSTMAEREMVRVSTSVFKYRVDYENWQNDSQA